MGTAASDAGKSDGQAALISRAACSAWFLGMDGRRLGTKIENTLSA